MKLNDPPVISFAKQNNIPTLQTDSVNSCDEFKAFIQKEEIDLFIVLAFAQFLKQEILDMPKMGSFNIHTSILPKYRGAAPIQYAILNGETSTGVCIQKMVRKMDAGAICYFIPCQIDPKETGGSLYEKLKRLVGTAINGFFETIINDSLVCDPQDETQVTYAPSLKKEDGLLDFFHQTALELERKVRAFFPWPGTFTYLNGQRLKVIKASISPEKLSPGQTSIQYGSLLVGCKEQTLRLNEVQLEGKKACQDTELLNGLKNKYNEFKVGAQ